MDECDEKSAATCLNGATCKLATIVTEGDMVSMVTECACAVGYSGKHCEVNG